MPKLTNLVRPGTLVWHNQGGSMRTAVYRGKTVDQLHELEIVTSDDDSRSGPIIAVPRREVLVTSEVVLS